MVEVRVAVKALLRGTGLVVPPTESEAQMSVPAPWMRTSVLVVAEF
jgi:hypothetical protein